MAVSCLRVLRSFVGQALGEGANLYKQDNIAAIEQTAAGDIIAQTLARAFQNDPAFSWLLPDDELRAKRLPLFFSVMRMQSHRKGQVLASHDYAAASLWYPPGVVKHGFWHDLSDNFAMLRVFGAYLPRGLKVAEAMYREHPNPQPYVYLRYVGVAPESQGKGLGSAVIRAGIKRAAAQGCGVLLETATPENVGFYSRLGFEITSEWTAPGAGPKFWTMVHPLD